MNQVRTEYLSVRLGPWEKERAALIARAEEVSVSELVRRLLDEHARSVAENRTSSQRQRAA